MRRPLFCFCAAFAAGCVLAQYLLVPACWPTTALAALGAGALGLLFLRGAWRGRTVLAALGIALALGWSIGYARLVVLPNEALIGQTEEVRLELCGYAAETKYGAKATVRVLGRGLHGRAVYYGDAELLDTFFSALVSAESSATLLYDEPIE